MGVLLPPFNSVFDAHSDGIFRFFSKNFAQITFSAIYQYEIFVNFSSEIREWPFIFALSEGQKRCKRVPAKKSTSRQSLAITLQTRKFAKFGFIGRRRVKLFFSVDSQNVSWPKRALLVGLILKNATLLCFAFLASATMTPTAITRLYKDAIVYPQLSKIRYFSSYTRYIEDHWMG